MGLVVGIVLAAGMGTRMRSQTVKVLHPLGGKPMLTYPIQALQRAGAARIIVVVGHQADRVREHIDADVEWVVQREQLGTGHAVRQAAEVLAGFDGDVLVTYGDTPLYRFESYANFIRSHREHGAVASVMTTVVDEPDGYGRIVRDADGRFEQIVEQRDITSSSVENIREINTGTYCFRALDLFESLQRVSNDNEQGEYYLPDALTIIREKENPIHVYRLADPMEALGVNDRTQLAVAEGVLRRRILQTLMKSGVTIVDPDTTYVHPDVEIQRDTIIYPFTSLEGTTRIAEGSRIGPHARLVDADIGKAAVVQASYVTGTTVPAGTCVGPFVHLKPVTTDAP